MRDSQRPPIHERPSSWWTLFVLTSVAVLAFVPRANRIVKALREQLGTEGVRYLVIGVMLALVTGLLVSLVRRRRSLEPGRILRILLVPALLALWMLNLSVVAEAFHLLAYALLGYLAFRALAFSLPDPSVYVVAALTAALVGAADELVQWIVPQRIWDLHDLGLNAAGAVLAQIWIAFGLRPSWLAAPVPRRPFASAWKLVVLLAAAGAVLVLIPALSGTH